jgi:type I restriction enzyme M protein
VPASPPPPEFFVDRGLGRVVVPEALRTESERFHRFTYEELLQRDKVSLDLFWLRDDSLDDGENLPAPEVLAAEIVEDLEAALAEFAQIAESLGAVGQTEDA